jgi:hypothetical protein
MLACHKKGAIMNNRLAFAVRSFVIGVSSLATFSAHAQSNERTIVDATWVVGAHRAHIEAFSVKQHATLLTAIKGLKGADMGFRVRLVNAEDVISCGVRGGTCRELPFWTHGATKAFSRTDRIPPGNWAFLIEPRENILKRMTVRVFMSVSEWE